VPTSHRRVIEARDRGCRVPGCAASRWLHVHHLTHWEDGGPTDPTNLVCLCPAHHRAHHRGELSIEGDPTTADGLVATDTATGRILTHLGGPSPPGDPPAEAARALGVAEADWRHPSGERLDRRWVMFARAG
jgi:HNH endonuclease